MRFRSQNDPHPEVDTYINGYPQILNADPDEASCRKNQKAKKIRSITHKRVFKHITSWRKKASPVESLRCFFTGKFTGGRRSFIYLFHF